MSKKRTNVQDLIWAGSRMANALHNISQMSVLSKDHAASSRESFREWDKALAEYRRISRRPSRTKKVTR